MDTEYLMNDPREAERLRDKVSAPDWVDRYLAPFLLQSTRVLDVGCGCGSITAAIGRRSPDADVTGIDLYPERFESTVLPPNVRLVKGDAAAIAFADNSFDLVICRFLLEYMKKKQRVVEEMVRVCNPRGTVLIQDLDGQMLWHYPMDPALESGVGTILKALEATGFDPLTGRKLYAMAYESNLVDIGCSVEPYHVIAGRIDNRNCDLWNRKISIAMQAVVDITGDRPLAERTASLLLDYFLRPDTFSYSNVITVSGRKPEQLLAFSEPRK